MMLVIFTDYDQVSNILKTCALKLARKAKGHVIVKLGPPFSNAAEIEKALSEQKEAALFFFGHGKLPPDGLIAQDEMPAVHGGNLALLTNRLVFAVSCYSAQSLAGAVEKHGATVLGYYGELNVSFRPKDTKLQTQCLLAAALCLLNGGEATAASKIAIREFDLAADRLIHGDAEDRVIAALVYRNNAQAVRLAGKNRKM